jgi:hypothetical protein
LEQILADPGKGTLGPDLTADYTLPIALPPNKTTTVFSPRAKTDALTYYTRLAAGQKEGLFMVGPDDCLAGSRHQTGIRLVECNDRLAIAGVETLSFERTLATRPRITLS